MKKKNGSGLNSCWRLNVNGEEEARWRQQDWRRWESSNGEEEAEWLDDGQQEAKNEDGISKGRFSQIHDLGFWKKN